MKAKLTEYEGCFSIELTAEDLKEAAAIARMGSGSTMEVRTKCASASKEGEFTAHVVFGKDKRWWGQIGKGK